VHEQRFRELSALQLSAGDRLAVNAEASAASSYDAALTTYEGARSDLLWQKVQDAEKNLNVALKAMNDQLDSTPGDCP
jgi:hypothetical protein